MGKYARWFVAYLSAFFIMCSAVMSLALVMLFNGGLNRYGVFLVELAFVTTALFIVIPFLKHHALRKSERSIAE